MNRTNIPFDIEREIDTALRCVPMDAQTRDALAELLVVIARTYAADRALQVLNEVIEARERAVSSTCR